MRAPGLFPEALGPQLRARPGVPARAPPAGPGLRVLWPGGSGSSPGPKLPGEGWAGPLQGQHLHSMVLVGPPNPANPVIL